MNNTRFGDGNFSYSGTIGGLYRIHWPAIAIIQLVVVGVLVYLNMSEAGILTKNADLALENGKLPFSDQGAMILGGSVFVVFLTVTVLSFVVRVWEFRYLAEHTTFNGVHFTSSLRAKSVFTIFVTAFLFHFSGS